MIRKDIIREATSVLKENNIRKPVSIPKQVFHISDDDGNTKDFAVKKIDKNVAYTADDVEVIFDACMHVIREALKHGDEIRVRGFGTLCLNYRKPRTVKNVLDGAKIDLDGFYAPKFIAGDDLKRCAQIYEQSLQDKIKNHIPEPEPDDGE